MPADCFQHKGKDLEKIRTKHSKILWIVLLINIIMFVVELINGIRANSLSLTSDSLDMLGDSLVYSSSLFVIHRSQNAQARVSLLKGFIMMGSALIVLVRGLYQFHNWSIPVQEIMTNVGILALLANLSCLILLTRHREDNLNMSSVWLCSRNDIIANSSVIVAALLIRVYPSPIPDLIVGLLITFIFTKSALKVIKASQRELLVNIK